MSSLISKANKQLELIKSDLERLSLKIEQVNNSNNENNNLDFSISIGQISASLTGLQGTMKDFEVLSKNEICPDKRQDYKEKLKLISNDWMACKNKFEEHKGKIQNIVIMNFLLF
jgi:hypothetical protein